MKDAKEQGVLRSQFAEQGALVCAVGALIGFGISIFQPIFDWRREALKPLTQYFSIGLTLCTPFVLGFLVFAWFIRTANASSRKVTHRGNQPRP
jgi:cell division protein FtsX